MNPPRLRRTAWMLTGFYAAFHFVMTHLPPGRLPAPHVPDKTLHFLSYGLISGCFYVSLWLGGLSVRRAGLMVLFCVASFACREISRRPSAVAPNDGWSPTYGRLARACSPFLHSPQKRRPHLSRRRPSD